MNLSYLLCIGLLVGQSIIASHQPNKIKLAAQAAVAEYAAQLLDPETRRLQTQQENERNARRRMERILAECQRQKALQQPEMVKSDVTVPDPNNPKNIPAEIPAVKDENNRLVKQSSESKLAQYRAAREAKKTATAHQASSIIR